MVSIEESVKKSVEEGCNFMQTIESLSKKVMLVIMDGYGINPKSPKNAIKEANKPNLDQIFSNYPYTEICSFGLAVGLPEGVMGNSEVGHMNIGAGRPIKQDLVRINECVETNSFNKIPLWGELVNKAKSKSKKVHLMGLLSDGGVHSHISHIKAIINNLLNEKDLTIIFHAFMDGRDTARDSGINFVKELLEINNPRFHFGSMQGRAIGMDRDKRYEKTEHAYKTLTGQGLIAKSTPIEWIEKEYQKEVYDEFITPVLFDEKFKIDNDDVVFFANYRPDRTIQLTEAFTLENYKHFSRNIRPHYFLCMTPYIEDQIKLPILFDKEEIDGTLSEYLSQNNIHQFKIAETEKFAHITFFLNGGRKEEFQNEDRLLIPSPRDVKTYDEKPEMSAIEVTNELLKKMDENKYNFYLVNYANSDMVGHTGNFLAAKKAVETVDLCVGKLIHKALEKNIAVIITSDHGNSDQMEDEKGKPHTAHTATFVPFSLVHSKLKNVKLNVDQKNAALKDIAPTVLKIMGIKIPKHFEGKPIFY